MEAGGLGSLLNLLQSSEDETIRRVAAGAVANLAMNGKNSIFVFVFPSVSCSISLVYPNLGYIRSQLQVVVCSLFINLPLENLAYVFIHADLDL